MARAAARPGRCKAMISRGSDRDLEPFQRAKSLVAFPGSFGCPAATASRSAGATPDRCGARAPDPGSALVLGRLVAR